MTRYEGNIEITEKNQSEMAKLLEGVKELSGHLIIDIDASLDAPMRK